MTEKQLKKKYLRDQGSACPYCNSADIAADHIEADGTCAFGNVRCTNCGKYWTDLYTLTGVDLTMEDK